MFIDETMFRIIALSFGWSRELTDRFIEDYVSSNMNMVLDKFFTFLQEKFPEKLEEIKKSLKIDDNGKFRQFKSANEATQAYNTLLDQFNLITTSYPEFAQELTDSIYFIEKELFMYYIKNGPDNGRLALIDYLHKKFEEVPLYPEVKEKMERLARDKEIKQVLGGPIYAE